MTRSRLTTLISALTLLVALSACKSSKEEAKLPPAKGEGAPPLPVLPDLGAAAKAGSSATADTRPDRTTGTLFARATANIAAKATGVITRIAVDEGDHVKKGALLFRVDASGPALQRDQAAAALKAANVQLTATKVEYDRAERLHQQKALTQAAFDQISARYQGAQVAVEQANVAVSMARKAIADTSIAAPISGTVTRRNLDVGDTVSTMPPTVVLEIQDQSVLELRFSLPEAALSSIRAGATIQAKFSSEAAPRNLTVDRIDPVVDRVTRTLTAVVLVDNAGDELRPGMLAEITVGDSASPSKAPEAPAPSKAPPAPAGAGR